MQSRTHRRLSMQGIQSGCAARRRLRPGVLATAWTLLFITASLGGCGAPDSQGKAGALPEAPAPLSASCPSLPSASLAHRVYVPLLRNTVESGEGLPGKGWYTPLVIQNVDTTRATWVVLEALPMNGTDLGRGCAQALIPAGGSLVFRPDNPQGVAGVVGIAEVATGTFQGSMVLHADGPLAVLANLQNIPFVSTLGTAGGRAKGAFTASRELDFEGPLELHYAPVKSGYFGRATRLFLQSTRRDVWTAVTAVLRRESDGRDFTAVVNLPPRGAVVLEPGNFLSSGSPLATSCKPLLPEARDCLATLRITSSERIAGVAVEVPTGETVPTLVMMNRLAAGELDYWELNCPAVKNQFPTGRTISSELHTLNVAPFTQTVNVLLRGTSEPVTPATSQEYWQVFPNVPALRSVEASRFQDTLGGLPAGSLASAALTASSGGDLTVTAVDEGEGRLSSYSCLPRTRGRLQVAIPAAKFEYASRDSEFAANTGIAVQNVGPSATSVQMSYRCRTANSNTFTLYQVTRPLGPYKARVFSPWTVQAHEVPRGTLCTVLIESSSENIVAVATESSEGLPNAMLDSAAFEGAWL